VDFTTPGTTAWAESSSAREANAVVACEYPLPIERFCVSRNRTLPAFLVIKKQEVVRKPGNLGRRINRDTTTERTADYGIAFCKTSARRCPGPRPPATFISILTNLTWYCRSSQERKSIRPSIGAVGMEARFVLHRQCNMFQFINWKRAERRKMQEENIIKSYE
jgi:hypothetical protein